MKPKPVLRAIAAQGLIDIASSPSESQLRTGRVSG